MRISFDRRKRPRSVLRFIELGILMLELAGAVWFLNSLFE